MIITVHTINRLSLVLTTIIGVASAQAGTVHAGHTGGHGNYHSNYNGGYYAHRGHGYYAHGGHNARYWQGGYYGGDFTAAAITPMTRPSL